jgi:hypothetical protein
MRLLDKVGISNLNERARSVWLDGCVIQRMKTGDGSPGEIRTRVVGSINIAHLLDNNVWFSKLNYVWSVNMSCI